MFEQHIYPEILLPGENKCIFCCSLDEYHLIRFSPPDVKLTDDVSGHLTDKAIGEPSSTHMPDLSTSLFGIYDTEHTKIEILKTELTEYCEPNYQATIPIYSNDFIFDTNRGFWFIRIGEINGKKIECTHRGETIEAFCIIEHTPTKCNFWHFSVRWYITGLNDNWHKLEVKSNNWWKKLAHSARIFIKGFGITHEPEKVAIEINCYNSSGLINH
ncbi:MAG: hypothetical protein IPI90_06495 [Saprospiraceae bacterium]|nr:hypothetical protein [Candidatus Vicinibacter affinis]